MRKASAAVKRSYVEGAIAEALLTHGRSDEDAAVLIYDGTLPSQETVTGTLGDIASRARDGQARTEYVV